MTLDRAKFARRFLLAAASLPVAWLAMFYLFALRARTHLGYWPRPDVDDPKDLGMALHHALIWITGPFVTLSLGALGVLLFWEPVDGRRPWGVAAILIAANGIFVAANLMDPFQLLTWFAD